MEPLNSSPQVETGTLMDAQRQFGLQYVPLVPSLYPPTPVQFLPQVRFAHFFAPNHQMTRDMDDLAGNFDCYNVGNPPIPWSLSNSRVFGRGLDNLAWQQFISYRRRLEILVATRINRASELILEKINRGETATPETLWESNMILQTGFGFPVSTLKSPEVISLEEPMSVNASEGCIGSVSPVVHEDSAETNPSDPEIRDIDIEFDAMISSNPTCVPSRPNQLQLSNDIWVPAKIIDEKKGTEGAPDAVLVGWTDPRLPNKWVPASDRKNWDLDILASVAEEASNRVRKSRPARALRHFKKSKWLQQWLSDEADHLVVQKSPRVTSSYMRKPSHVSIFKKLHLATINSPVLTIGAKGTFVDNPSYFEINDEDMTSLDVSQFDNSTVFTKVAGIEAGIKKLQEIRLEYNILCSSTEEADSMPMLTPVTQSDKRGIQCQESRIEPPPPRLEKLKL